MIEYQEALKQGIEIAKQAAARFFRQNATVYGRLGFDETDLAGHLYEEVLCKRMLPLVEDKPEVYPTLANFRAACFTACKNRLLVHHQAQVGSQKRGDLIRAGSVELDGEFSRPWSGSSGDGLMSCIELSVNNDRSYLSRMKELIDQCQDSEVWKALTLLAYGKASSKTELSKILNYSKSKFEQLWAALVTYVRSCFDYDGEALPELVFSIAS